MPEANSSVKTNFKAAATTSDFTQLMFIYSVLFDYQTPLLIWNKKLLPSHIFLVILLQCQVSEGLLRLNEENLFCLYLNKAGCSDVFIIIGGVCCL